MPTLIVAADADMAPPSHYVEVFALLDGGQRDGGWMGEGRPKGGHALAILPGLTHYNVLNSPALPGIALDFLDQRRAPLLAPTGSRNASAPLGSAPASTIDAGASVPSECRSPRFVGPTPTRPLREPIRAGDIPAAAGSRTPADDTFGVTVSVR